MLARAVLIASLAVVMGPRDALCALACSGTSGTGPAVGVASPHHAAAPHTPERHGPAQPGGSHAPCADPGPERSGSQPGSAEDCAADAPAMVAGSVDAPVSALAIPLPVSAAVPLASIRSLAPSRVPRPPPTVVPAFLENSSLLL